MTEKSAVLRETDEEARHLARRLLRGARFASLAVIDAKSGFPAISRTLLGIDLDGVPVILVSSLAAHTGSLSADPRCSIMTGEPGKGDPLAHARMTVFCSAEPVEPGSDDHSRIRSRFIARHRKAELYVDFPDFRFIRLVPSSASLNGGFGRAYMLTGEDLTISDSSFGPEWVALQNLAGLMTREADTLARALNFKESGDWKICGIDMAGIDLIRGDILVRYDFELPISSPEEILVRISNFSKTS